VVTVSPIDAAIPRKASMYASGTINESKFLHLVFKAFVLSVSIRAGICCFVYEELFLTLAPSFLVCF
jgi:hypothetical protein